MFGFNFAPYGWSFCNGQLVPISQNQALYTLLGTIYGGDGVTTFGLPDLQSRIPVHSGQEPGLSNYVLGQAAGTPTPLAALSLLRRRQRTRWVPCLLRQPPARRMPPPQGQPWVAQKSPHPPSA